MKILEHIKSWHIALISMPFVMINGYSYIISAEEYSDASIATALGIFIMIYSTLQIIPVLLLKYKSTRKFGAITAIILGVIPLILLNSGFEELISAIYPSIISLISAGIYYIWKKI